MQVQMPIMRLFSFFALLMVLLSGGCAKKAPIGLYFHGDAAPMVHSFPLDSGDFSISETIDDADITIRLRTMTGPSRDLPGLVARYPLIPVSREEVPWKDLSIRQAVSGDYSLLPPSEISLPWYGLSVNGLYPGDDGYPLYSMSWLEAEYLNEVDEELRLVIDDWLRDLGKQINDTAPPLWIAGVGDIMLLRGVEDILLDWKNGLETIFSDLLPELQQADLLLGNLEGVVTLRGGRTDKSYNFRFKPAVLNKLKEAGFDYLSLTNNHCFDFGLSGFTDTLKYLEQAGITTSGAGMNLEEAARHVTLQVNNQQVHILSIGAYPREQNGFSGARQATAQTDRAGILWNGEAALKAVRRMCAESGIHVVIVHGGHEWTRSPDKQQQQLYRSLVDEGVDIVYGSHPHVLQGMEFEDGGIIFYSLGNFIFNGMGDKTHAEKSLIARIGFLDGKPLYIKPVGVNINGKYLTRDRDGSILAELRSLSTALITLRFRQTPIRSATVGWE